MLPSVKTIMDRLSYTLEHEHGIFAKSYAKTIRAAMAQSKGYTDVDTALETINEILNGYGVEVINDNDFTTYWGSIGIVYVNMGDTYTTTVLYDTRKGRWYVSDWGTIAKNNEKRFNV